MLTYNGQIPMRWWRSSINYGDIIGPWLVEKMTGLKAVHVRNSRPHYRVLGPLIRNSSDAAILWGAGCWGIEKKTQINPRATYLSVRGPLTRWKLARAGAEAPAIYGDPALLLSQFHQPRPAAERYPVGVMFRWSEGAWAEALNIPGVKMIEIKTDDIEGTIDQICACDRLVTTSLHGLITADVYGIPVAWLHTHTTNGGEYKFLDYFLSVDKNRLIQRFDPLKPGLTLEDLLALDYTDGDIRFDPRPMIEVNPFGWAPSEIKPIGLAARPW